MLYNHHTALLALTLTISLGVACSKDEPKAEETKSASVAEKSGDQPAAANASAQAKVDDSGDKPEDPAAANSATPQAAASAGDGKSSKRYEVESGMVEYKQEGVQIGTEVMLFRDFGALELKEVKAKMNLADLPPAARAMGMGGETHNFTLIEGDTTTTWDADTKRGTKIKGTMDLFGGQDQVAAQGGLQQLGVGMIKSLGGTQEGTKKVAGLECTVWDIKKLNGKVCEHKGVSLEADVELGGMKQHTLATKVDFSAPVPADKFQLPADIKLREMSAKEMLKLGGMKDGVDLENLDKLLKTRGEKRPKLKLAE